MLPADLPNDAHIFIGGANGTVDSLRLGWSAGNRGIRTMFLDGPVVITGTDAPLTLSAGGAIRLTCSPEAWGVVEAELV